MRLARSSFFAFVFGAAACSSSQLQGSLYRGEGVHFQIGPLPAEWQRIRTDFARLAFRSERTEATLMVNARCGRDDEDIPLATLTRHLFLTFTEREVIEEKTVPMDAREALHTIARAKLDGVPKMFDVYVLKKDGCVYDFVIISAPESFESNRAVFELFVTGFHASGEGV